MEPTRRFWVVGGLALASAVLAVLFTDARWLAIPLGITVWVLVDQLVFTTTLTEATQRPPLRQTLSQDTVLVDEPTILEVEVTDSASRLAALGAEFTITDHPAVTADTTQTYSLAGTAQGISIELHADVAGTYTIDPPTVTATSHRGLFTETLQLGNQCSLTGEPRVPRDIHIGTGGERIAVAAGEHDASQGQGGFQPGELREYLPGDPTNRIDWKATARLGEPYIRDVESESTRRTHLVVDRRPSMQEGPAGLTKLDHARETAIWLTEHIASLSDPLALTIVGEDTATGSQTTDSTTAHYQRIRQQLLAVTADTANDATNTQEDAVTRSSREARDIAASLTDDSQFAQTLQPYFQHVDAYLDRVTTDPLFQTVQSRLANDAGDSWLVIVTDDTNRAELLETTRMAAAVGDTHVSVFVLPSVLFDEQAFTDLDDAYAEYRDFEEFRQQLAATANTTAFEVGPRDRLAALLEATPSQKPQP